MTRLPEASWLPAAFRLALPEHLAVRWSRVPSILPGSRCIFPASRYLIFPLAAGFVAVRSMPTYHLAVETTRDQIGSRFVTVPQCSTRTSTGMLSVVNNHFTVYDDEGNTLWMLAGLSIGCPVDNGVWVEDCDIRRRSRPDDPTIF